MSFLAPFYLLGGLAITLPIVFHMIRRTPKGRTLFSSVMFLEPSPPRTTQRSRVEDWLLLILRGLIVGLIALAFARPFLRAQAEVHEPGAGTQQISFLIDRSASMQRTGYWERALKELKRLLRSVPKSSEVRVGAFDSQIHWLMEANEWQSLPSGERVSRVLKRAEDLGVGWHGTQAGQALIEAADVSRENSESIPQRRTIVLISDMQTGGGWDALQTLHWPEEVEVQVVNVSREDLTNASMQLIRRRKDSNSPRELRVMNSPHASHDVFQLGWQDPFTPQAPFPAVPIAPELAIAPGESRIVAVPPAPENGTSKILQLSGDEVEFDNLLYLAEEKKRLIEIITLTGQDDPDSPNGLVFFLEATFPDDATREIRFIRWDETPTPPQLSSDADHWFIIGATLNADQTNWLKRHLEEGGQALFVARDPQQAQVLYELLSLPPAMIQDANNTGDMLLQEIDLDHPVFKPFDDPRFSDFTRLRFWKHRQFDVDSLPGIRKLAAFEDGFPALAEIPLKKGRILLLASGWNRDDSDLAVSSKFVPLMNSLLEYVLPPQQFTRQAVVGDTFPLSALGFNTETVAVRVQSSTSVLSVSDSFEFDRPAFFRFAATKEKLDSPESLTIAVNLPAEESLTDTISLATLTATGMNLFASGRPGAQAPQTSNNSRQQLNQELESHQQWWRWLVVATILVLVAETLIAIRRLSSRSGTSQAA